ncbi:MAG TPA: hypothetical protein VD993_02185 [Chitinophagaceae bacterium]|nr:hypothetical protein [Chitinophagaceae bacterium]
MKLSKALFCLLLAAGLSSLAVAQRKVSEMTLVYDAVVSTGSADPKLADAFDGAVTTIYISGHQSRSEMVSALFTSTTIHDAKSGSAVVLREVSGQKLLIRLTPEDWADKNKRYQGISFTNTNETKVIAGYTCTKAIATTPDGSTFTVYYTKDIIPENKEYDYQFRSLQGLPLEYEMVRGNLKIKYTVSQINLNPVAASKFDIPKAGYREMTYQESKKMN